MFVGVKARATSGIAELILEVDDLADTIAVLQQYGVMVHGDRKREAWVAPEAAGGVILNFQSAF